jgi:hypothetical protein
LLAIALLCLQSPRQSPSPNFRSEHTLLEQLIEAFELCEPSADFSLVIERYSVEQIEDAIASWIETTTAVPASR